MENTIMGYSGHAFSMIDALEQNDIHISYYCEKEKLNSKIHKDIAYLGFENDINVIRKLKCQNVYIGIGDLNLRKKIFHYLLNHKINLPSFISNYSYVSKYSVLGETNYIHPKSFINSQVNLGDFVLINTGAIIEHNCKIDSYCVIGPNSIILGNVKIGENSFIGAGAIIKEGVTIGKNVVIGAGTVVIRDIEDNLKAVGNPSRII